MILIKSDIFVKKMAHLCTEEKKGVENLHGTEYIIMHWIITRYEPD